MLVWSHNSFLGLLKNLPGPTQSNGGMGYRNTRQLLKRRIFDPAVLVMMRPASPPRVLRLLRERTIQGSSRVGVEMQKSFVSFCGQVGGCYFICEVVVLLCCFLYVVLLCCLFCCTCFKQR